MDYINSELIELLVVCAFPIVLLYFFRGILPREFGLTLLTGGLSFFALGIAANYSIHTPLREPIAAILGPENLIYIRPVFYIPGGLVTLVGLFIWFRRVIDFQAENRLRKTAEKLLGDKNELIAEVLESSRQGILLIDKDLTVQLTNRRFLKLLDLPEEFGKVGTSYKQLVGFLAERGEYGAGDVEQIHNDWVSLLQNNTYLHFQRSRPDGTILDIEARWIPKIGMLSAYTDVTKQSHAERDLKKSEERFKDFTMSASDWMWELNSDMKLSYISDLGVKISGQSEQDLIGKTLPELLAPVDNGDWDRAVVSFQERDFFKDIECFYNHPNGRKRYFSISGKPYFDSSDNFVGYRGVGRDITARRAVEEQLQHAQKMEAIGRLTGGIAHDFNNLLAIILGNTELLMEKPENRNDNLPFLGNMEKAALRGAELTQQLLSFSRKQRLQPSAVDLEEGLTDIVALIGRSLGEDIKIDIIHGEDLWHALTDLGQLENAILNLANNARDAMPNGGALTLSTENHDQLTASGGKDNELAIGEYIILSVSDTGSGMSEGTKEMVFEPFFTTKDVGKGTGLGLSMVFGFAKQSNGHVCVESTIGAGTTVKLFLPRAQAQSRLSA